MNALLQSYVLQDCIFEIHLLTDDTSEMVERRVLVQRFARRGVEVAHLMHLNEVRTKASRV